MTSATPWSIKGIDRETRKKVKQHANDAGVTMGEWLSTAVDIAIDETEASEDAEQSIKLDNESFKMTENLEASQIQDCPEDSFYLAGEELQNFNDFNAKQTAETMKYSRNNTSNNTRTRHDKRTNYDYSNRSERHVSSGFNVIENALTDIVDHIELADKKNVSALRNMQAQIVHLHKSSKTHANPNLNNIRNEFNQMGERLSSIADRIDKLNENINSSTHETQEKLQAEQRHREQQTEQRHREQFDQSDMLSRFDELFVKLDNLNHNQNNYGEQFKYLEEDFQTQLDSISNSLQEQDSSEYPNYDDDINNMDDRLSDLAERLDYSVKSQKVDPQILELEQQIGNLSGQLTGLMSANEKTVNQFKQYDQQKAAPSPEIASLKANIAEINDRLENTEKRLEGIDRLEQNMDKLVGSVAEIRDSSSDIAAQAASAAVASFAKTQAENVAEVDNEQLTALLNDKLSNLSKENDRIEQDHKSGFKTVQSTLEIIMDRLTKVETDKPAAPRNGPPPDQQESFDSADQTMAEQDFIQPGAETIAEQPQENTASPEMQTISPDMMVPEDTATKAIITPSNNTRHMTSQTTPATNAQETLSRSLTAPGEMGMPKVPQQKMQDMALQGISQERPQDQELAQDMLNQGVTEPVMPIAKTTQTEQMRPVETIDPISNMDMTAQSVPIGSEQDEPRPIAQTSSSTDFIAAARRAAQQTFDDGAGTSKNDKTLKDNKSLFSRIKQAATKNKPSIANSTVENIAAMPVMSPTEDKSEIANISKKQGLSLANLTGVSKKKDKSLSDEVSSSSTGQVKPTMATNVDDFPENMFEENFFGHVDVASQVADEETGGNQLNLDGSKRRSILSTLKSQGAAPIIAAVIIVAVVITLVTIYASSGNQETSQQANLEQNPSDSLSTQSLNKTEQVTPANQTPTGDTFSPSEFEQFPENDGQIYQPTEQQYQALQNSQQLVTNSIPSPTSVTTEPVGRKSYNTSLLGNSSKFTSRSPSLSKMADQQNGMSSLSKSNTAKANTKNLPKIAYGMSNITGKLPVEIGPQLLRDNALMGQAAEQFEIANRYALGFGVEVDLAKSYKWFVKAADNNLAVAQFSAGMMLEHGKGVERNLQYARIYYQRAAKQGNLMSIYRLAMMNAAPIEKNAEPDFKTALKWFNLSANAGLVDAQYNLAILYEKGHGTDVDLVATYKWYSLAAQKGDKQAKDRAKSIKLEMSAAQISKAKQQVKEWQVNQLPKYANTAPNLAYLKHEGNGKAAKVSKNIHIKAGVLDNDIKADKKTIKDTQKMLKTLGWKVGAIDGVMGGKTRKAIREFQTRHKLKVTGEVNDQLLASLEDATL